MSQGVDTTAGGRAMIAREDLGALFAALRADGYQVLGPTVRDGAIVLGELRGPEDLPAGVTAVAEAGRYRLARRSDAALFGFAVGPGGWKPFFLSPEVPLLRLRREDGSFRVVGPTPPPPRLALVGVRSCDLHAIAIQDRILLEDLHVDADYAARRRGTFTVAVQCTAPGGTCFCASMGTGPRATAGFDLALTERLDGEGHRFVVEVGSPAGAALLARLPTRPASAEAVARAEADVAAAAGRMGRALDTRGLKALLYQNLDNPRWDEVAERCLACANCTLVCPTCFCTSLSETADLSGAEETRTRRWDSCFTLGHSHLHGGPVRTSVKARYRQWLTHKLASWIDQFGMSGCVGCGRCITWCPAGIDLTEEVAAIRTSSNSA